MSKVFVATYCIVYTQDYWKKKIAGPSVQQICSFGFITNKSASS